MAVTLVDYLFLWFVVIGFLLSLLGLLRELFQGFFELIIGLLAGGFILKLNAVGCGCNNNAQYSLLNGVFQNPIEPHQPRLVEILVLLALVNDCNSLLNREVDRFVLNYRF